MGPAFSETVVVVSRREREAQSSRIEAYHTRKRRPAPRCEEEALMGWRWHPGTSRVLLSSQSSPLLPHRCLTITRAPRPRAASVPRARSASLSRDSTRFSSRNPPPRRARQQPSSQQSARPQPRAHAAVPRASRANGPCGRLPHASDPTVLPARV